MVEDFQKIEFLENLCQQSISLAKHFPYIVYLHSKTTIFPKSMANKWLQIPGQHLISWSHIFSAHTISSIRNQLTSPLLLFFNSLLEFNCPGMRTFPTKRTSEILVRNQASNIHCVLTCICASKESTPSNEPSFLPGNLAEMQHGALSVSVNFLALEPGIEKG